LADQKSGGQKSVNENQESERRELEAEHMRPPSRHKAWDPSINRATTLAISDIDQGSSITLSSHQTRRYPHRHHEADCLLMQWTDDILNRSCIGTPGQETVIRETASLDRTPGAGSGKRAKNGESTCMFESCLDPSVLAEPWMDGQSRIYVIFN
jgi:hypothetical protein